jgi:predicted DNA-binding mobile mystery protein A
MNAARVKPSWITYMRKVMGMTLANLAKATKVATPTIKKIEQREAEGRVTLETMRKIANAMNCHFIYAFVPEKEVYVLLKERAHEKAAKLIRNADIHMTLEDQRVTEDFESRVEQLADVLLKKGDIW